MNGATPENPCGITALLPSFSMSCRGRAEEFARRLQSRLRTLGSQSTDASVNHEESHQIISATTNEHNHAWISTTLDSPHQVTSIQPLRQISHEADSFFDFDCEPESPGSPAEECEYSRLIETASITPNDFASESGYICSSPLSIEVESHENSNSSSDGTYFDPENSDIDQKSLPTDYFDCDESKTDDSSLNTTVVLSNGHYNPGINYDIPNDSSESLTESLPPSQESTSTNTTTTATPSSLTPFITETLSENTLQDMILNELQNYDHCNTHYKLDSDCSETFSENTSSSSLEKLHNVEKLHLTNEPVSNDNISNLLVSNQTVTELCPEKDTQIVCKNLKSDESSKNKKQHLSIGDNTDDEDDYRPQRIRRSSSLKSGKTPPGTPSRKKIVRFADVLGLDLADIKTFLDEVPTIPKSAYEDLDMLETEQQILQLGPRVEKILMPLFQQPGGLPTFLDIVRDKQVSLENAIVSDAYNLTISGCVRVRNLDFHKSVHIRYTLDSWKSYADLQANYIENSCDGFSDKFSFILFGNSLTIGQRLEFAIRFHCKGQLYWDNNYGANYCFQCLPSSNTSLLLSSSSIRSAVSSSTTTATISTTMTSIPSFSESTTSSTSHQNMNSSTMSNHQSDAWCSSFY